MELNEKMIQVNHLSKSFGTVKAVNDISFQVKRGELFAFLGKTVTEIAEIPLDDGVDFEVKRVSDIMDSFEYPGIRLELNALMSGMVIPIKIDISTGGCYHTKRDICV